MNKFGEVLQELMESRDLGAEDLSVLLKETGHEVSEEKIEAFMEGDEWVDGYFSGRVAEVLNLNAEEMGVLARAVAYGQTEHPP